MEKSELIDEFLKLQRQTESILRRFSPEPWIELNLTVAQLKSLFFIMSKEKTNFKKLAEALGVTPPNVTGIIDRLVEQGLVSRTENPQDRRIMLLQLTENGQTLLNSLIENQSKGLAQVLNRLSNEELSSLVFGFNALVKAAQTEINKRNVKND
jgi:MarR family transcriptional regulator, organic hydroperoxide resistance regulator